MQGLNQLIRLQRLDHAIQKLQATRDQLAQEAADVTHSAEQARLNLENCISGTKSFRASIDKRDVDLKTVEERITKLSTQLNIIKTNKEYAAIQHEILAAKESKSGIEDDMLTMMDEAEQREREVKELEQRATEAAQEVQRREQDIANAIDDADTRIARVTKERGALAAQLPANLRQPYERLLQGKRGHALAACRNFVCEGCRMSLTANTVNLLMAGDQLIYCHSCGRILYLPEDEDTQGGRGAGRT